MFVYSTYIQLRDTDATGVIFFTEQLRLALEAFEAYLRASGCPLGSLLQTKDYLLPIVRAEADYTASLMVGDQIEIRLTVEQIGSTSFQLGYRFFDLGKQRESGSVRITHVAVSKKEKTSIPIPLELLQILKP